MFAWSLSRSLGRFFARSLGCSDARPVVRLVALGQASILESHLRYAVLLDRLLHLPTQSPREVVKMGSIERSSKHTVVVAVSTSC